MLSARIFISNLFIIYIYNLKWFWSYWSHLYRLIFISYFVSFQYAIWCVEMFLPNGRRITSMNRLSLHFFLLHLFHFTFNTEENEQFRKLNIIIIILHLYIQWYNNWKNYSFFLEIYFRDADSYAVHAMDDIWSDKKIHFILCHERNYWK